MTTSGARIGLQLPLASGTARRMPQADRDRRTCTEQQLQDSITILYACTCNLLMPQTFTSQELDRAATAVIEPACRISTSNTLITHTNYDTIQICAAHSNQQHACRCHPRKADRPSQQRGAGSHLDSRPRASTREAGLRNAHRVERPSVSVNVPFRHRISFVRVFSEAEWSFVPTASIATLCLFETAQKRWHVLMLAAPTRWLSSRRS